MSTLRRIRWEVVQQAFTVGNCLGVVSSHDLPLDETEPCINLRRTGGYLFLLFGLLCFFRHLSNCSASIVDDIAVTLFLVVGYTLVRVCKRNGIISPLRSEEHTSELQSH